MPANPDLPETYVTVESVGSFPPYRMKPLEGDCVISSTPEIEPYNLEIFPNPAFDQLRIKTNKSQIGKIQIYDIMGQVVLQDFNQDVLDVSSLESGMYFIKVDEIPYQAFTIQR